MSTSLSNLVGHKEPLAQLERSFHQNTLSHALLFTGLEGIGKKRVALGLGAWLLGDKGGAIHPDLHLYSPETQTHSYTIDQIREIHKIAECSPYTAPYHLFILDEAEGLTLAASNAFLKLLEEPPPGVYFILITSKPYKLLPTVLSRLQKIAFKPLSREEFSILLKQEGGLELGLFDFMAESSIGKARQLAPYVESLTALMKLLPFSYLGEIHAYQQLFNQWEEDKKFDFLEFFPFFEALLSDWVRGSTGRLTWVHETTPPSLVTLNKQLKVLEEAYRAHIKPSVALNHFFIALTYSFS